MSTDLVSANPRPAVEPAEQFADLRKAQLHNPNNFLKVGVVPASTTCFAGSDELEEFKKVEAQQNADPESRALANRFGKYLSEYGRYGNPTTNRAEEVSAIALAREDATIFPSRNNAITSLLSGILLRKSGHHHIILGPNVGSEIIEFCENHLKGVSRTHIGPEGFGDIGKLIGKDTRLVLLDGESATIQNLAKIDAAVAACREHKVLSVVGGEAAGPRGPASLGSAADVLIPISETLSNDGSISAGIIASSFKVGGVLKAERGLLGGIPAPEISAAIIKGIETLPLRVEYGRLHVPTLDEAQDLASGRSQIERCERKLARLERADSSAPVDAALFPSGMSATTVLFSALLFREPGPHHIIVSAQGYRKNREFYDNHLKNFGVEITRLEPEEFAHLEKHLKANTRIVFIETPTNPFFRVTDVQAATALCRKNGSYSVVDHTFATPINQRPLDLGADFIAASATKYLGGHNDAIAGVIAGSPELMKIIKDEQRILGAYPAAITASRVSNGLTTLDLRIADQNEAGLELAAALHNHPLVKQIWYPGHPSHKDYEIASRTMDGFGGVISFELKLNYEETGKFVDALKLAKIAPSFGGNEPIVSQVVRISHWTQWQTAEGRKQLEELGISPGLVRYSTGTFPAAPLIRDIMQALEKVKPGLSEGVVTGPSDERSHVFSPPPGSHRYGTFLNGDETNGAPRNGAHTNGAASR